MFSNAYFYIKEEDIFIKTQTTRMIYIRSGFIHCNNVDYLQFFNGLFTFFFFIIILYFILLNILQRRNFCKGCFISVECMLIFFFFYKMIMANNKLFNIALKKQNNNFIVMLVVFRNEKPYVYWQNEDFELNRQGSLFKRN
jgi:hypothetical protein